MWGNIMLSAYVIFLYHLLAHTWFCKLKLPIFVQHITLRNADLSTFSLRWLSQAVWMCVCFMAFTVSSDICSCLEVLLSLCCHLGWTLQPKCLQERYFTQQSFWTLIVHLWMILFQLCITLCSLLLVRFHSQSILSTVLHHLSHDIALFIVFIHLCMLSTVCSINKVLSFSFIWSDGHSCGLNKFDSKHLSNVMIVFYPCYLGINNKWWV